MSSDLSLSLMQKSTDLWYPDGTVILQAENTIYCAYGGFLSQHSAVFKDMFEACQNQPHESFEGRPVIPMFDTADDVFYFLKAMHDTQFFETQILTDVARMMTVLRMMTKYQVRYLRQRMLETLLRDHCPSTDLASYRRADRIKPFSLDPSRYVHIINGARAAAAPILLPSALYHLAAAFGEMEILQGVASADGATVYLDEDNKLTALLGLRNLREAMRMRVEQFLYYPTLQDLKDCTQQHVCRSIFAAKARQLDRKRILPTFREEVTDGRIARISCETCFANWQRAREEALKEVWDALPSFFDLPTWRELMQQSQWAD